jgi:mRNA interferase RelE/StbE
MADYAIVLARSARKELEALREPTLSRVLTRIENLAHQPRPSGCVKLEGSRDLWRIRVGEYRIVYSIVDRECLVDIVAIRHRSDVYR